MYIVLTAMLALNVAAQVLEAYRVVDSSLIQTLNAVDNKNQQIYSAFEQAYAENPAKVQDWKSQADQVKEKSNALVGYIDALKEKLVLASGTVPRSPDRPLKGDEFIFVNSNKDTLVIKKEDDLNTPSEIMIAQKEATNLKEEIGSYREFVEGIIPEEDAELKNTINQELETSDSRFTLKSGERRTWESLYFENKPLAAILTLLSKLQIDVKNSEANLLNYLYFHWLHDVITLL